MTQWKVLGYFEVTVLADDEDEAEKAAEELMDCAEIQIEDVFWVDDDFDGEAENSPRKDGE